MTSPIALLASLAGADAPAPPAPAEDPTVFAQLLLAALSLPVAPLADQAAPINRPADAPPASDDTADSGEGAASAPAEPVDGAATDDSASGPPIAADSQAPDELPPPPRPSRRVVRSHSSSAAPGPVTLRAPDASTASLATAGHVDGAPLHSVSLPAAEGASLSRPTPIAVAPVPSAPDVVAPAPGPPATVEPRSRIRVPVNEASTADSTPRMPAGDPPRPMLGPEPVMPPSPTVPPQEIPTEPSPSSESRTPIAAVPVPGHTASVGAKGAGHAETYRAAAPVPRPGDPPRVPAGPSRPQSLDESRDDGREVILVPRMSLPEMPLEASDVGDVLRPRRAPRMDVAGAPAETVTSPAPPAVQVTEIIRTVQPLGDEPMEREREPEVTSPGHPVAATPEALVTVVAQTLGVPARLPAPALPARATPSRLTEPVSGSAAPTPARSVTDAVHGVLAELAHLTGGGEVREVRVERGAGRDPVAPPSRSGPVSAPPPVTTARPARMPVISPTLDTPSVGPMEGVVASPIQPRQAADTGPARSVPSPNLPAPRQEMPPEESERSVDTGLRRVPEAVVASAPTPAAPALSAGVAPSPMPRMGVGLEPAPREARNLPRDDGERPRAAGVADRVTIALTDDAGRQTRIRVAVLGEQVRATIVPPDGESARQLEARMDDLTAALVRRGFVEPKVMVQHVTEAGSAWAGVANRTRSEAEVPRGTDQPAGDQRQGSGRRGEEREGDGQQRHPHHRPRQRDPEDRRR